MLKAIQSYMCCCLFFTTLSSIGHCQEFGEEQAWQTAFNENLSSLLQQYDTTAVVITKDGAVLNTPTEVAAYLAGQQKSLVSILRIDQHSRVPVANRIRYEIATLQTKTKQLYKQLVVRKEADGRPLRLLEMTVRFDGTSLDRTGINQARNRWMGLCNQHNARKLVEAMYLPEAIYYNHRPVVIGTDAIAETYRYMNRETYHLLLAPLVVEAVDATTAFEIGQCSGSYGGKYVLVWRKTPEGAWKVLMDANL